MLFDDILTFFCLMYWRSDTFDGSVKHLMQLISDIRIYIDNEKVTNSQLDTTNESQEVSPLPAGDQKAHINRRIQMHSKQKKNINDPQKKYRL